MRDFIRRVLLARHSVNGILWRMQQLEQELQEVAEAQASAAADLRGRAQALLDEAVQAERECSAATKLRTRVLEVLE